MRKQDERAFFLMSWTLIFAGFYVLFSDIFYGLIIVMIGLALNHKVRALFIRKYNMYFNPEAVKASSTRTQKSSPSGRKFPFNFGPILKKIKRTIRGSRKD